MIVAYDAMWVNASNIKHRTRRTYSYESEKPCNCLKLMNPQPDLFPEEERCAFCGIAQGTTKATVVFKDESHVVFLDRRPLNHGHCLVVPVKHFRTTTEIDPAAFANLMILAKKIVTAVEVALQADGSFLAINNVISQSIPHLHVHAVPRFQKDGLFSHNLAWHRKPYKDEEQMREIGERIRLAVGDLP